MPVDEAAVLEAIEKIEKDGLGEEIMLALAGNDPTELAAVVEKASLTEKEKKRVQAAFRILGSDLVKRLMADDKKKKPAEKSVSVTDLLKSIVAKDFAAVRKLAETIEGAGDLITAVEKLIPEKPPVPAGVRKDSAGNWNVDALPENQRESVLATLKAADAATTELAERVEKSEKKTAALELAGRRREFITKAADYKDLPSTTPDDFGSVLMEVDEKLSDEAKKKLNEVLKACVALIQKSEVLQQLSISGGAAGSAEDKINTKAKALVEKSTDNKFTFEMAVAKVCTDNPELHADYTEELKQR